MTIPAALADRLDSSARMTGGTMPLIVVLDPSELADAAAYLKGRRWASMLELLTPQQVTAKENRP